MNVEVDAATAGVVCPHCHVVNGVPRDRLSEAPSCEACRKPLFEGRPVELAEEHFMRYVQDSDLPLVVDFWAPWCAPCRAMAPVFERAAGELEPGARFAKVNTDENPALVMALGIRGIPTLAIFKGGAEVARTSGAMDPARFSAWVRAHL